MDLFAIKNEIKRLKKEEQLQSNILERHAKKIIASDQKSKAKTLAVIDDFQLKLDNLATFYQRVDLNLSDTNANYISEQNLNEYELIESDIDVLLETGLKKLMSTQNNSNMEDNDESLEKKYQESLYLKHEAEMVNIELQAELASIDAQINWLNGHNDQNVIINNRKEDEIDKDIELSFSNISDLVKQICCYESILEIKPDVEKQLNEQKESVKSTQEIYKQYNAQLDRQHMILHALEEELQFHDSLKDNLECLTQMVDSLERLNRKVEQMNDAIDSLEKPGLSEDEQLLIRMKGHFEDNFPDIQSALSNSKTVHSALVKETCRTNEIIDKFRFNVDVSIDTVNNIYEDSNDLNKFFRENSSHSNSRIKLVNKENYDQLQLGHTWADEIKNKLREIKKSQELIKVDVMPDE